MIVDIPDILFHGLLKDGHTYIRVEDVVKWIHSCGKVARSHDLPPEVGQWNDGLADAIRKAKVLS